MKLWIPKHTHRTGRQNHPPLRTLSELCEEFGVSAAQMRGRLSALNAPKPAIVAAPGYCAGQRSYFEPKAFRIWWASLSTTDSPK